MTDHDDLGMAVDVLRIMRETLGPDRFRRAVEEAEQPAPRPRKRARVSPANAARRAADLAPPDELARAKARRGR